MLLSNFLKCWQTKLKSDESSENIVTKSTGPGQIGDLGAQKEVVEGDTLVMEK